MHPDAVAGNNSNAKQRFYSGNVVITGDGPGAWNGADAATGTTSNPGYVRMAFDPFAASGTGTPRMALGNGAGLFSYLNRSLSKDQVRECLRIANYLAAPFGTTEYTLVNYGTQGVDWTPSANGPLPTATGTKYAVTTYQFLATGPSVTTVTNGYTDVARAYATWQATMGKYVYKPMFYDMNISLSSTRLATALAAQSLVDTAQDVYRGRKTIADYRAALADWRSAGGNDLRKFYDNVRSKYGTGQ
jgi:putative aldouronate transport system substrate-binding protein